MTPTGDEAEVRCPKCDETVYTRNAQGGEWWANVPVADRTRGRAWRKPVGCGALLLGIAGFIATYIVVRGGVNDRTIAGLLNPLFFLGVPLGLYWLLNLRKNWKIWAVGLLVIFIILVSGLLWLGIEQRRSDLATMVIAGL